MFSPVWRCAQPGIHHQSRAEDSLIVVERRRGKRREEKKREKRGIDQVRVEPACCIVSDRTAPRNSFRAASLSPALTESLKEEKKGGCKVAATCKS